MSSLSRRDLLKQTALAAAGLAVAPVTSGWSSIAVRRQSDSLVFRPFPHELTPEVEWAYATDANGDPFKSAIQITQEGIVVPRSVADRPFALNAQWFVEGFGNVWLDADNQGRMFTADDFNGRPLNLSVAFAETRVARNAATMARYQSAGSRFSPEVSHLQAMSADILASADGHSGEDAARIADQALLYALWAGEKIELEHARQEIARQQRTDTFYFGCESRQYIWAKSVAMTETFEHLFNYATVTHYVYDTWYPVFEPEPGNHKFGLKDDIVDWLTNAGITIEGRPLFWFHSWVMDDWLKDMSYDELKNYVVKHASEVVGHYGDRINHYEVMNEYHDWANWYKHTPEQTVEITRLACETTRDANPNAIRIINNCCTWAEYAARGSFESGEADRPLRSPRKFVQDLVEADVPFEVVGVQMYFPNRCIADMARMIDRFEAFGKPVQITEIGTSSGPTREDVMLGTMPVPKAPYEWHRPWDEDLQADWLEQTYTMFYSRPWIEAVNWYDFADFRTFIPNGGLIRVDGETKPSYHRLEKLQEQWGRR